MDRDTWKLAQECLIKAGAIVKCSSCNVEYVLAYDDTALARAYDMAEELRKAHKVGFRGMTHDEIVEEIKSALDGMPSSCPRCDPEAKTRIPAPPRDDPRGQSA